jgi:hypothetical protein
MVSSLWVGFQQDLKKVLASTAKSSNGLGSAMTDRVDVVVPFMSFNDSEKAVVYHQALLKATSRFRNKVDVTGKREKENPFYRPIGFRATGLFMTTSFPPTWKTLHGKIPGRVSQTLEEESQYFYSQLDLIPAVYELYEDRRSLYMRSSNEQVDINVFCPFSKHTVFPRWEDADCFGYFAEHLRTLRYSYGPLYAARYRDEPELRPTLTITHDCTCSDLHTMPYHKEDKTCAELSAAQTRS